MSQDSLIKLICTKCSALNYHSRKNKKIKGRLELNKLCKACNTRTPHKESK
jgi:ribosomal protein L33